ncbi:hypothetical protein VT52_017550 [Streptomyces malaysiense]|uniref:Uncharacterized protein n=1 Tax=Streptomyces malaysiense TaxID=1428626 RepID=A0A1J4PYS9_9ACTN|nr:hypothetical protein VT52_017550 [Streptomyces malaysiense]
MRPIKGFPPDVFHAVLTELPLKDSARRLIEPEEAAEAVARLCGPQASFVTGTSLVLGLWPDGPPSIFRRRSAHAR